jgi:hypothetical protein
MSGGSRPAYLVKAKQSPESEFLIVIGAAFKWKNGDGYVVQLHSIPVKNWDGSFILAAPKSDE